MTRDALEHLLHDVTDEELEHLRDAILREEGRRRAALNLSIEAPFPPLVRDEHAERTVMRWAKLLTWLAKDSGFPPATGKRGVSITILHHKDAPPDPQEAGIILQQALVQAGLLGGRTGEWVDATTTRVEPGTVDAIRIQMWEKPGSDAAP